MHSWREGKSKMQEKGEKTNAWLQINRNPLHRSRAHCSLVYLGKIFSTSQSVASNTIFHTLSLFGVVYIVKHHLCALLYAAPDEYTRQKIRQQIYIAEFSGQNIYTLNFAEFQQLWWKWKILHHWQKFYTTAGLTAVTNLTSGVYLLLLDITCFWGLNPYDLRTLKFWEYKDLRICQKLLLDFLLSAPIIAKADFPLGTNFSWDTIYNILEKS